MTKTLTIALLTISLAFAGCTGNDDDGGDDGGNGADANHVRAEDNRFNPTSMTIDAGTEVHFENVGQNEHTVTIHKVPDPPTTTVKDDEIQPGEDTHYTFAEAGTYHAWCKYHGTMTTGMTMTITVE